MGKGDKQNASDNEQEYGYFEGESVLLTPAPDLTPRPMPTEDQQKAWMSESPSGQFH